ncbi:TetR/AcrR family transcriptional regulator [Microbacterium betulae]|uniref:TetR/AcrR family transcriptional regulator n=1 Tax=Microbacterium betulae TaxID=2981139 RepID=A0AA97I842_9MICO|nr:TetR/AcrR family transcriptional regulator [Microbacterium sp. AB]WOF24287.1 TetR/AcrR family transcriptional regulator [Microbacterium sp. AB]
MTTKTGDEARTGPRRRGPYAKTAAVRTAILDAALDVFGESGYRSGSLREVADRVGMSEAGVLHHFPNKNALLADVLDRRDLRSYAIVPKEGSDGEATLRGLVRLADYNATVPGIVKLFAVLSTEATSSDHPAHAYFVTRYETTRSYLRAAFSSLMAQGRVREGVTPERAAIATIAMMDGLQVQWLLEPGLLDMGAQLRRFLESFVDIDLGDPARGGA